MHACMHVHSPHVGSALYIHGSMGINCWMIAATTFKVFRRLWSHLLTGPLRLWPWYFFQTLYFIESLLVEGFCYQNIIDRMMSNLLSNCNLCQFKNMSRSFSNFSHTYWTNHWCYGLKIFSDTILLLQAYVPFWRILKLEYNQHNGEQSYE